MPVRGTHIINFLNCEVRLTSTVSDLVFAIFGSQSYDLPVAAKACDVSHMLLCSGSHCSVPAHHQPEP